MADKQGQAEIRDLFIDKLVKGFADEELTFKSLVTTGPTPAREIRWVQKTAGFLTSPTTTGITTDMIETSEGGRPVVIAQSWTRNTSYVKLWKAETETISDEDIKDNMVDILAAHIRDVTRAVVKKVNDHLWSKLNAIPLSGAATGAIGWETTSYGGDPIADIETAKQSVREYNYEPTTLITNPKAYRLLVSWLFSKGAQAPTLGQSLASTGQITQICNLSVHVSNSASYTSGAAYVGAPKRAVTYREFSGLKSATIEDPMIGIKVRVGEEGIGILTDPYAGYLIKALYV